MDCDNEVVASTTNQSCSTSDGENELINVGTRLANVHIDCLERILFFLQAKHLIALVSTGDFGFCNAVFRAASYFELEIDCTGHRWPRLVRQFYRLTHVMLVGIENKSGLPDWTKSLFGMDWNTLPPTLKSLSIHHLVVYTGDSHLCGVGDGTKTCEEKLLRYNTGKHTPRAIPSHVFANLTHLSVIRAFIDIPVSVIYLFAKLGANPVTFHDEVQTVVGQILRCATQLDHFECLHKTIEHWGMPPSLVPCLPRNLSSLSIDRLPPKLDLSNVPLTSFSATLEDSLRFANLPPTLTTLHLTITAWQVNRRELLVLPNSVIHLSIDSPPATMIQFLENVLVPNPNIQSFFFYDSSNGELRTCAEMVGRIVHAMPGLRRLTCAGSFGITKTVELAVVDSSLLPRSLTELSHEFAQSSETWHHLPRQCRVIGPPIDRLHPFDSTCSYVQISPQSLEHVANLPDLVDSIHMQDIEVLPQRAWFGLTSLSIGAEISSPSEMFASFPQSLTTLRLYCYSRYLPLTAAHFAHLTNLRGLSIDVVSPRKANHKSAITFDAWIGCLPKTLWWLSLSVDGEWTNTNDSTLALCQWPPHLEHVLLRLGDVDFSANQATKMAAGLPFLKSYLGRFQQVEVRSRFDGNQLQVYTWSQTSHDLPQ